MRFLFIRTFRDVKPFAVYFPLGAMGLASVLRDHAKLDCEVKILDMPCELMGNEQAAREAAEWRPDAVGLSSLHPEAPAVHDLTAKLKKKLPDTHIIIGGPSPSHSPREVLADRNIDFAVLFEGEETLPELLLALGEGAAGRVRGIGYRSGGKTRLTEPRPPIEDLDALPFPAWDLIDRRKYDGRAAVSPVIPNEDYVSVFTSRGCPYRCVYCHKMFGKRFRARSPESVVGEIRRLVDTYNPAEIQIIDDIFNFDVERAERICDLIVESGLKFRLAFANGLRIDILTERLLDKMKAAGCFYSLFAVESASPRLQRLIRKNIDLKRAEEIFRYTDKLGIMSNGTFMVGFPTETLEEMRQTRRFAWRSPIHTATFLIPNPFPGTELARICEETGVANKLKAQGGYHDTTQNLNDMDPRRFKLFYFVTYIVFYLSPWRAWRLTQLLPDKTRPIKLFFTYFIPRVFSLIKSGLQKER